MSEITQSEIAEYIKNFKEATGGEDISEKGAIGNIMRDRFFEEYYASLPADCEMHRAGMASLNLM